MRKATPDDLVLISWSGHGYADSRGVFYLLPYDIGPAVQSLTPVELGRMVSSDELSLWLREVDAGDLALIIDTCQSAASVEGEGFKPGPMGSRGLGQLAYDKGMRILAGSQADNVAVESDQLKHVLLTYTLVCEGLQRNQAAVHHQITLDSWLRYGADRVPRLFAALRVGKLPADRSARLIRDGQPWVPPVITENTPVQDEVQMPAFFNFTKQPHPVVLDQQ
ncbi:MAG: caspase family protein [Armatimonadota bacterium]